MTDHRLRELERQLAALRDTPNDWDGYGSPAPNSIAIETAGVVLRSVVASGFAPKRVVVSADGGIGIALGSRSTLEVNNDGEVWLLWWRAGEPAPTRLV